MTSSGEVEIIETEGVGRDDSSTVSQLFSLSVPIVCDGIQTGANGAGRFGAQEPRCAAIKNRCQSRRGNAASHCLSRLGRTAGHSLLNGG